MRKGSWNTTVLLVWAIAIGNIVLHLAVYNNLEYHRDELLYFSLGNHPSFGYATVPPLIGWIAWVMQLFFGYSLFAVKFFPALLSGALVLLSARITKELGGMGYAQILTAIAILCLPVGLRAFHLFQPVPIDLFMWTVVLYFVLRYVHSKETKYLKWVGLSVGVALLNKYLVLLLVFSLLCGMTFTKHRTIWKQKELYLGMGTALLLLLPNLIWQAVHGFPVIGHMQALQESQLVYVDRMGFFMDQLLLTFSVCFLVVIGWAFLIRRSAYRFLAITATLVILLLILLQGKSYYTIGIYPFLVAAGSVALANAIRPVWLRLLFPILILGLTLPALPIGIPLYEEEGLVAYFDRLEKNYGLEIGRRFEDGTVHSLPQDYAD
ncbi:MAG: glycosyltransferase family 39 protein, partial [Altibacter sp.]|nr:glycosyltransferase family 39 protein [Altibacter sp.]